MTQHWTELDRASATSRIDVEAIDATANAREAIAKLAMLDPEARDVLHAAAMLGRLLAALGASPALAAATIDGLSQAVKSEKPWVPAARASLMEAYVAEREERAFKRGFERWSYPTCCVHLGEGECAIAAGIPDDDDELLVSWSDGVARALARAKVRRVVISGTDRARKALEDALSLVGIAVRREFVVR